MVKQMRMKSFCKELQKKLQKHPNPNLHKLAIPDLIDLMVVIAELIASTLRSGKSVIFDRFFSFYLKPIKRSGFNKERTGHVLNYFMRVRFRPNRHFRKLAELELSSEEYEKMKESK